MTFWIALGFTALLIFAAVLIVYAAIANFLMVGLAKERRRLQEDSLRLQREIYDLNVELTRPYRETGERAIEALRRESQPHG